MEWLFNPISGPPSSPSPSSKWSSASTTSSAEAISAFVNERPTVKVLALSFLLLVGFSLVAEGFHQEIPKGYLYFAMAFSVFVEMINSRIRRVTPVRLKKPIT